VTTINTKVVVTGIKGIVARGGDDVDRRDAVRNTIFRYLLRRNCTCKLHELSEVSMRDAIRNTIFG
jgi:hypothetical protein